MRQPKLFLLIHAAAGRLLAISKGRVENGNSRFVHNYFLKRRACRLTVGNSPIRQADRLRPALLPDLSMVRTLKIEAKLIFIEQPLVTVVL
jgi:hypothetical protein